MEFKGTKGEWQVVNSSYKDYVSVQSFNGQEKIEDVFWVSVNENLPEDLEKQKANAKLIAAAPEFLEALQSAMKIVELWAPDYSDENFDKTINESEIGELAALSNMRQAFEKVIEKALK